MKKLLGGILIVLGLAIGLGVGIGWAFVGGIMQVIVQIRAPEMNVSLLVWGVVKFLFAGPIGWASGMLFIIPGGVILRSK